MSPIPHPKIETHKYDAGALLDSMRPGIEELLQELAKDFPLPECPSQSLRALRARDAVVRMMDSITEQARLAGHSSEGFKKLNSREIFQNWRHRAKQQRQLDDFLAVHRTVELLERK